MTASNRRGSVWHSWDPHVHTPGTSMNNQFGADDWDEYLTRIEAAEPRIASLNGRKIREALDSFGKATQVVSTPGSERVGALVEAS